MRKHGRSARSDALRGKNCNKYTFLVLALADRVFALERGRFSMRTGRAPLLTDPDYRKKILWR